MADDPTKVSVDLNVLNDSSISRLEQFGTLFSNTVNTLTAAMASFSDRASSMGASGPSGTSPNASVAPGYQSTKSGMIIPSMTKGWSNIDPTAGGGAGNAGTDRTSGVSDNASVAPVQQAGGAKSLGQRVQGMAYGGPFINSYEQGQIRLGQFPSYGLAQAMIMGSWMSASMGWNALPEEVTDSGKLQSYYQQQGLSGDDLTAAMSNTTLSPDGRYYQQAGTGTMANISSGLGLAGQSVIRGSVLKDNFSNWVQGVGGLNTSILGQQAGGFSRTGGPSSAIPLFSKAWWAGEGISVKSQLQSWGGFNPQYPTAQAKLANQTIAQSGYWGDDAKFLSDTMQNLWQNTQLQPDQVMSLLDPSMRFGGEAVQQLVNSLKDLNDISAAAHIGLSQLGSDIANVAPSITQSTGMGTGYAASAMEALSAGTRLSPTALTGLASSQNLIMGAALTGTNISDVMQGKNTVEAMGALPMAMAKSLMGGLTIPQYQKLQKTNPKAAKQIANQMWYAYNENQQIFGGLTPTEMLNQMAKGVDPFTRMQSLQNVLNMTSPSGKALDTKAGFLQDISQFGGTDATKLRSEFTSDLTKAGGQVTDKNAHQLQNQLVQHMTKLMNTSNAQAKQEVTIMLDPQARKLLKLLPGASSSSTNTGDSGWHVPSAIGKDAIKVLNVMGKVGALG